MVNLNALPVEILDLICEHLVISVGIPKAVLLRTVSHAFDAAVLQAICVSQVIDIHDPATPYLSYRMAPTLRGRIIAVKSRSADAASKSYVSVVARVNQTLDGLVGGTSPKLLKASHDAVAGQVELIEDGPTDSQIEAQNVLCGASIIAHLPVLESVLECGEILAAPADINGSTPYFETPLTLAAALGHYEVVRYLLDRGARVDSVAGHWCIHENLAEQADWKNHDEEVQSASLHQQPSSALRAAVSNGHTDIVHLLLRPDHRLPINSLEYLRAIVAGAWAGRLDLIEILFDVIGKHLSDFPVLGSEMLLGAVRCDHKEVVQMLLDEGVDINAFPDPPRSWSGTLHMAASLGNIEMIRFLLERGADVNFFSRYKRTKRLPIQGAALCGQEEIVQLLIDHGADPAKAFISAAGGGQWRVVNRLLSSQPDLPDGESGSIGREALSGAITAGNLTTISVLVDAGVSLNEGYEHASRLPLMEARSETKPWVVNHLIALGAQEIDEEPTTYYRESEVRRIRISERTWQWVSKY